MDEEKISAELEEELKEELIEEFEEVTADAAEEPAEGTAPEAVESEAPARDGGVPEEGAEEEPEEEKPTLTKALVEIVSVIATSVITIMLLFTFVFRIVGVVGESMEQTLHENDWLLVSAHSYRPERGDIIIITQPNGFDDEPIVKRIIAVGGDTLDIDFTTAEVFVNGKKLNETYLNTPTTEDEGAWKYPLKIPEGKVFVMGDNRQHSTDSRSTMIGLIDTRYILGQVRFRFSPIKDFAFFKDYDYASHE